MNNLDLSGVMNAVRKKVNVNWEIGDELIKLCGPAGDDRAHDGSQEIMRLAMAEIESEGFDGFSISYLSKLRVTSTRFPSSNRFDELPWSFHVVAGSPKILDQVVRIASLRKQKITQRYVIDTRKEIERDIPPTEEQVQEEMDLWLTPMLDVSKHIKEVIEKFDTRWNVYLSRERMSHLLKVLEAMKKDTDKLSSIVDKAVQTMGTNNA